MTLRGPDISSWQPGFHPSQVECDLIIVKATGGTGYTNPYFIRQAQDTLAAGKKLGIYHFARERGCAGAAADEARYFLNAFKAYQGVAIPILDWEADAVYLDLSWASEWLQIVSSETGARPWFYSYSNYVNSHDCSRIASYPLWIAAYYKGYEKMGWQANPPLIGGTGDWDYATAYQYTSSGRVGYNGDLDLNIFYGDAEDWDNMAGGGSMTHKEKFIQHALDIANDDSHGYSWADRWDVDRDCSSLMYDSAYAAGYPVSREDPRYTGTMYAHFTAAGFTAIPYSRGILQAGDVLLAHNSERQHTEMYIGDGKTVGAHIAETGGVYGQPGDQTGNEISIAPLSGKWDWVLRPPEEGEDMTPEQAKQLKFIYDHLHWDEKTHFSDLGNLIAEFPVAYPTLGENGEEKAHTAPLAKRLGYVDQRTHAIEANQAALEAKLDSLDAKLKDILAALTGGGAETPQE